MLSKKTRKGLSVVVVWVLLLSITLVGCNKSNNEKKLEASESKGDIKVSIYDRGNIPAEEGTAGKNRWTQWIKENAPVNVNFVPIPRWQEDQKYNTLLASGGMPDVIFTWTPALVGKLYSQKLLMPLDDLINQYSPEYKKIVEKYPALKKMGTRNDGKIYQLGAVAKLDVQVGMLIRADWLKKLKLEIPKTTEELFNVIKAFAEQDPDGNNKKDTYGFHLSSVGGQLADYFFGSGVSFNIRNGEYIYDWEASLAGLAYKKRLYDADLIDKDYLTDQAGEKALQDFVTGRLGIYGLNGIRSGEGLKIYESLKANNPNAEIIAMPLPKSEFGQFSPDISPPYYLSAVVSSQSKNPKAVMQYLNFLLQESTQKTLKYGIEGEHWTADAYGCPKMINADKSTKEVGWAFDLSMLSQPISEGDCLDYVNQLNPDKQTEKEYIEIIKQARAAYISPDRPLYHAADVNAAPDYTEELVFSRGNGLAAVYEIYAKAIVGGASYSIDKANVDAKAAWEKAGGKLVDEFALKWYSANKDKILLSKDYYSMQ